MQSNDLDSVVTKSRTLLEEVLIYIIDNSGEKHSESGDLVKLYNQCKLILGLNIKKSNIVDDNVKKMLSGLETIQQSIAAIRNNVGIDHGQGDKREEITKSEAKLCVNSIVTLCEYLWDLFLIKEKESKLE